MSRLWVCCIILVGTAHLSAAEPSGKIVRETWDAAFLNGEKAGHVRTAIVESKRGEQTVLRVSREVHLTMKRFGQIAELKAQSGDEETPDGKLLGVFMVQDIARGQQSRLVGEVVNGMLQDASETAGGSKEKRQIRLPDDIITILGEESLLRKRRPKPGERLSYRLFEPTVYDVVKVDVHVVGYDQIPIDGVSRKLLRASVRPQRIEGVQLPPQTIWYDEEFSPVLSQGEIPGLGEFSLKRTTKEKALAPLGALQELGEQSVLLDRTIQNPHQKTKIVYRVSFAKEVPDLVRVFATDHNRQSVQHVAGKSLELVVSAVRTPSKTAENSLINKEYLRSNFFINCDDPLVRQHAANAVGDETDSWKKAQLIEKWVKDHMKAMAFTEAMATADHVAKTLTGDCTEYAMLAAAMCRAQDIPSRTALGLVYYNDRGQAKFGYHMWTEVNIRGDWLALDATLGQGSVGPAHIKITDHSWYDTRSMTPLLPVMRVMMGKPKMEVLKVE